jgi:hypothetical protein
MYPDRGSDNLTGDIYASQIVYLRTTLLREDSQNER